MSIDSRRLESERLFHDEQARQRTDTFRRQPLRLRFSDEQFLGHESWIRSAWAQLEPLSGKDVLDCGCGHGMAAVVLARHGARVAAVDLSGDYLAEGRQRAAANDVHVNFVQADAHALPFEDESFDAIWGNAVLHHLDLSIAGREIRRVLRPGGVAVFCEPWGGNPLLRFARRRLPYHSKGRTRDEEPLRRSDLTALRESFPGVELRGFQLLSMIRRAIPLGRLGVALERVDSGLLHACRPLENWCRYVVLTLRRG
jgi:SAM-dependent methyltransferase